MCMVQAELLGLLSRSHQLLGKLASHAARMIDDNTLHSAIAVPLAKLDQARSHTRMHTHRERDGLLLGEVEAFPGQDGRK